MRAIANERLWSVIVEHENEEEEVGVQDSDFPIMSVDNRGRCVNGSNVRQRTPDTPRARAGGGAPRTSA